MSDRVPRFKVGDHVRVMATGSMINKGIANKAGNVVRLDAGTVVVMIDGFRRVLLPGQLMHHNEPIEQGTTTGISVRFGDDWFYINTNYDPEALSEMTDRGFIPDQVVGPSNLNNRLEIWMVETWMDHHPGLRI